jgi:hypothetical protein
MSRSNDIAGLTTSILDGVTATEVGLGNVTNESKATMFASPTFTGTITAPNDSISGDAISGGTIGAGTFDGTLGSNATFPAGHIIKSSGQINHSTSGAWDTTSSTYVTIKESDGTTPVSTGAFTFTSGNKVLIMWSANLFPHNGGSDVGQYCRISTTTTDNNNFISSMPDFQAAYINTDEPWTQLGIGANLIFTDSPSGTSVTYYLQSRASHGGTVQYNRGMSHIHLFEIQA